MTNLSYSPITGGEGNIEFLMLLKYNADKEVENSKINIEHIVIMLIITLNRGGTELIQLKY